MPRLRYDPNIAPNPATWLDLGEQEAQWLVRRYHASPRCEHPQAESPVLHATIHVVVENQVALGDKTPAHATLERLMREGLNRHDAIHAIGSVFADHMYELMHSTRSAGEAGTRLYYDAMCRLTAEAWRRSADDTGETAEWLKQTRPVADWSTATPDEIVQALCVPAPHFPRAALRAAERMKEQIADQLLTVVQDAHRRTLDRAMPEGNGHIFAMMLLAEIEDPRAFDVITELFALPADLCEQLSGDFVTEDLGRVLASVCGGQIGALARIVEDRSRWEYVRGAALTALCALVQRGRVTRDGAIAYLTTLIRETLRNQEGEPSSVWDTAASSVLDLYAHELFDDLRRLIDEGLINPLALSKEDVDRTERQGLRAALTALDRDVHLRPVRDIVAETEWWHCYAAPGQDDWDDAPDVPPEPFSPPRRAVKVGRNDPCPCGSGKKFKKCCLHG